MSIDNLDLVLLKQELVEWHETALEGCELLLEPADKAMLFPSQKKKLQFKTAAEISAFRAGVILARGQFSDLPFDDEVEND
ncbi:hypothetical protein ABLA30_04425 [Xenorhabdus nematophila]|uniref:Uncharacterized protein n=1 Tax=Xenorhabdus ehlersii TaxID=290111 RepID=A0A2D0ILA1_9GAMM|nr:hypothetical protein [Xenorhabdus ehlersii]PHM22556.1 hypothetical protein Xehl_03567 [Xenorhabdus ehlersii]RKE91432.1 hypothetical protein BDE27_1654 [Xenorhabdus ehlersii]